MQLLEKFLALIGWGFVLLLGAMMVVINIIPILTLFMYCLATRKTPHEVVELVFSH